MRNIRNPQPKALLRAMGECHLLDVNNLCGFGGFNSKSIKDSYYVGTHVQLTSSVLTWTHVGMDLGVEDPDRYIVVTSTLFSASGGHASITVGGVALTKAVEKLDVSYNQRVAAIYVGKIPTGKTADIVVTKTGSAGNFSVISVYALYKPASATPYVTLGVSASPSVLSSNVVANSFGVAVHGRINSTTATHTWVGLTENHDQNSIGPNNGVYTSASHFFLATESPRTISVNNSGDYPASCFAAWS